jgi:L-ribulokinase
VAVGNVDAHVTVAAADALDSGQLVAIIGTSTCHVMNSDVLRDVPGMCGVVDGGILEGSWGYEAGQSGVGDIFAWFIQNCVPESYQVEARERGLSLHEHLTELAGRQRVGEHGLVALDWHSGNRSVLVDHELSGVIVGQTLETTCVDMYRALLEATAFGTRMIVETFVGSGVPVTELVVAGGLLKNRLMMQIYADVVGLPLSTVPSTQAPALGSAIHAATAAGAFTDVRAAAKQMGRRVRNAYIPIPENVELYDQLYREYVTLYDWFGRGNDMMRRLRRIGSLEAVGASR